MTHHHAIFMAHSHNMAHHHHQSSHHHHHHHHSPRHHQHHHHHRDHNDIIIPIGIWPVMTIANASNSRPSPPVGERSLLIPKDAGVTLSSIWTGAGETTCSKLLTMSTTLYLHHHGDFTPPPTITYVGGKTEDITEFDSDLMSFRDLEDFAQKYDYDVNSLIYFKCDGFSFSEGIRVIYDDGYVRDLVDLSKPYGRIDLYVDHFNLDDLIDVPQTPK
ncbi:hypothetical protein AgCh_016667 [Apium graveolens]